MASAPDERRAGPERSWDEAPMAGWDAFLAARDVFLLGLAVDTALYGIDLETGPQGVIGWNGDPD
jgi:hypothetical protein